jgi:hypothetical protein
VVFDEVFGKERRVRFERFYFHVPDGVEAGRRVLGIDLEQSEVRLPFDLWRLRLVRVAIQSKMVRDQGVFR